KRKIRAVDSLRERNAVEPIERPPNGLAVWNEHVELVQSVLLFAIENAGHQAMDGKSGNAQKVFVLCRTDDRLFRSFIVDRRNHYAEDVSFSTVAHSLSHRSIFCS